MTQGLRYHVLERRAEGWLPSIFIAATLCGRHWSCISSDRAGRCNCNNGGSAGAVETGTPVSRVASMNY